jgi:hypothetical protein
MVVFERAVLAALVVSLVALGAERWRAAPAAHGAPGGPHVFVIVLENQNWASIVGSPSAPYINRTLLPQTSYATQYYNPPGIHPSLPNYLWLLGGQCYSYCGTNNPPTQPLTAPHLTAQLDQAGLSWGAYEESASPGVCPTADSYAYAVRHDPFIYFADVTRSTAYCTAHVKPYTALGADLARGTVPRYVFITPNVCDDGHTRCAPLNDPLKQADNWLAHQLPHLVASAAYQQGGAVFITWDEGVGSDGPIGLLLLSPLAKGGGYHNSIHYTHSSLLRTVQEMLGLSPSLGGAATATDLGDLFKSWPPR